MSLWVKVKAIYIRKTFPRLVGKRSDAELASIFDMVHGFRPHSALTVTRAMEDASFMKDVRATLKDM